MDSGHRLLIGSLYTSLGTCSLIASCFSLGYGYWHYERKARAIKGAEAVTDLQTLVQRVGIHRDFTQAMVGPRVFCKMAGTVGCKSPLRSGATGVQAAISEVTYIQRINLFQSIPKTQKFKIPFTCDLPGGGCIMVNDEGAELHLEVTTAGKEVHEKVLRCGGPVFAVGSIGIGRTGSIELSKGLFRWFLVSYLSEEEILKKYRFWWNVHRITSVGLAAVGVYFLVMAVNEI